MIYGFVGFMTRMRYERPAAANLWNISLAAAGGSGVVVMVQEIWIRCIMRIFHVVILGPPPMPSVSFSLHRITEELVANRRQF